MPFLQGALYMANKYICKHTCFHSTNLKEYVEGVTYDISPTQKREFDKIGFMEHFEEDLTPQTAPVVPEKEETPTKKG